MATGEPILISDAPPRPLREASIHKGQAGRVAIVDLADDLLGAQLEVVGGGVLFDAGDALGAGDRGDVVALSEQPGQGHLCRCGARLGSDGLDFVDDAEVLLEVARGEARVFLPAAGCSSSPSQRRRASSIGSAGRWTGTTRTAGARASPRMTRNWG